jgi:hypothetical protein
VADLHSLSVSESYHNLARNSVRLADLLADHFPRVVVEDGQSASDFLGENLRARPIRRPIRVKKPIEVTWSQSGCASAAL